MSDAAWGKVLAEIVGFSERIRMLPVVHQHDPSALRAELAESFTFGAPRDLAELTEDVIARLRGGLIHVTHPRYFGLFNPSVHEASVIADTLTALYNPQLAAWSHAPVVQEMEQLVLRTLTALIGFPEEGVHAAFTSGGAEANLTAVLAAIAHRCPESAERGVSAFTERPAIYVTDESHHSFLKAARMLGLGTGAIRVVRTTPRFVMDVDALDTAMAEDAASGWLPLMVVATAGTTAAGMVDPIPAIADVAARRGAWLHVDAAWGGAAAFSAKLKPVLLGIERADSVTWDAHKWLSVPMGAGMIFCRHPEAVHRAFAVHTSYMPPESGSLTADPYAVTAQWSRRAIGLKLFLPLAQLGVAGFAERIEHQAAMGDLLRVQLRAAGWSVVNDTMLPVVNFTHADITKGRITTRALLDAIYARGNVWFSDVVVGSGTERVLRACITSFHTTAEDVGVLVGELERVRGES